MRFIAILLVLLVARSAVAEELSTFVISDAVADNYLVRQGKLSAHVLRLKGKYPRLLFAFPAGNSGALLEFTQPADLRYTVRIKGLTDNGHQGHGITVVATLSGSTATVGDVVAGSIREIRQHVLGDDRSGLKTTIDEFEEAWGKLPKEQQALLETAGVDAAQPRQALDASWRAKAADGRRLLEWVRSEYLGDREYRVVLALPDTCQALGGRQLKITCAGATEIPLEITATTPYRPLTPIASKELLGTTALTYFDSVNGRTAKLEAAVFTLLDRALNSLRFLAYEEKLLAGSFRFLTYFGRDTLITARMLLPVAGPKVMEAAYRSVIERMNRAGEVAHEESLGNRAILERIMLFTEFMGSEQIDAAVGALLKFDKPVMDYKMVDDNFLLAPFVRDLFAASGGTLPEDTVKAIIAGPDGRRLNRLADNLELVLSQAADLSNQKFGVSLLDLNVVGNWRDSELGLGGGAYAGDVNTFLVQSALVAVGEILDSRHFKATGLEQAVSVGRHPMLTRALKEPAWLDGRLRAWEAVAKKYQVKQPLPHTRGAVRNYIKSISKETQEYLNKQEVHHNCNMAQFARGVCYPPDLAEGIRFPALSLDWKGKPIKVMHTDPIFALFDAPQEASRLQDNLKSLTFPFPLGLWTEVGPVVANPVFADQDQWAAFDNGQYHGTVVWGWVLGMLELAVMKQQDFLDDFQGGCKEACDEMARIKVLLAAARKRVAAMASAELWTWEVKNGGLEPVAFGSGKGHTTLSNAVQLWSTVWLAVYYRLSEAER